MILLSHRILARRLPSALIVVTPCTVNRSALGPSWDTAVGT